MYSMKSASNDDSNGLFYIIIFFVTSGFMLVTMILFLIIINSEYSYYFTSNINQFFWPIIIIFFTLLSIVLFGGINGVISIRKKGVFNPKQANKVLGMILFALIITANGYFLGNILTCNNPSFSTFQNHYQQPAGPFLSFGPTDNNHKISTTSDSMCVWWFDPIKKNNPISIKYGLVNNINLMTEIVEVLGGDGKYHQVIFTQLEPSTRYYYQIPNFRENEIFTFKTGPSEGTSSSFRFMVVGDTRNSGGSSHSYYGELNSVIDKLYNSLGFIPDFKINLGDIACKGTDLPSWKVFFDDIENHSANYPYMIAFGNHEFSGDRGANYDYLMTYPKYYSFDYANAHFLFLHTFDGDVGYPTGSTQYEWVKNDLQNNKDKKWTIVNFHVPFLSSYTLREDLMDQYFDLFRENHVDLVLTGHDHHFEAWLVNETIEEQSYNGTYYFINGGGGSPLDSVLLAENGGHWNNWYQNESTGFQMENSTFEKYHLYSELSWGFMDVQIDGNMLNITYCRWLDFNRFLAITNQTNSDWSLRPFTQNEWEINDLDNIIMVERFVKIRVF